MLFRLTILCACIFMMATQVRAQFGDTDPGKEVAPVAEKDSTPKKEEIPKVTVTPVDRESTPETPGKADSMSADKDKPLPRRTVAEWNKVVSAALTLEAVAKDDQERIEAILALVSLYTEGAEARYLSDPVRKDLRYKLRSRLVKIQKELKKKYCSDDSKKKQGKAQTEVTADSDPQSSAFKGDKPKPTDTQPPARGGGAKLDDYADELIEIIQATISPGTWDVNGGNGSIYYFRNGRAMVIRAPQQAHDHIGELMDGLRRAGQ